MGKVKLKTRDEQLVQHNNYFSLLSSVHKNILTISSLIVLTVSDYIQNLYAGIVQFYFEISQVHLKLHRGSLEVARVHLKLYGFT